MKCPHCGEGFFESWQSIGDQLGDVDGTWIVRFTKCPTCERGVLTLLHRPINKNAFQETLVRPKAPMRSPLSSDVPETFAKDYREACLVLGDSPKASAALSRRCLQNILREHFTVKAGNLSEEMDEVLPRLPSYLAEAVDAIRASGNFAAHPMKSTNSGEILDVEPGEAEWSLDVLEGLFDFCFVQPAVVQAKRHALNKKLAEAGKHPLKQPAESPDPAPGANPG